MRARKVGLLVNPIAGMGGAVGLKGTDDVEEARRRGAKPVAEERAVRFLERLPDHVEILTASGSMGEEACEKAGLSAIVVYAANDLTSAQDTGRAAQALADAEVDVVAFVGGDGTARDVLDAIDERVPVLGVPSGVKMYSAVFADTPEVAASVIATFDTAVARDVLDIDEEAFRKGDLRVRLHGTLRVPSHKAVQSAKLAGEDDDVEQASLADAAADAVRREGGIWILGAGTTMLAVKRALGIEGSLLGVDAVDAGGDNVKGLVTDGRAADLERLPDPLHLMVSPIGAQGFILGRGNLQLTPTIVRRVGIHGIRIVATPSKLLATPTLHADSGDAALDRSFPRFVSVLTGYHGSKLVRME
ncbi:MAG: ATP-NAD kinase family protein [Thermoplasmatota archaeon]